MNEISNLPTYAYEYRFIVTTMCDTEFWFYGAYNDMKAAGRVADEVGGVVVINNWLPLQKKSLKTAWQIKKTLL